MPSHMCSCWIWTNVLSHRTNHRHYTWDIQIKTFSITTGDHKSENQFPLLIIPVWITTAAPPPTLNGNSFYMTVFGCISSSFHLERDTERGCWTSEVVSVWTSKQTVRSGTAGVLCVSHRIKLFLVSPISMEQERYKTWYPICLHSLFLFDLCECICGRRGDTVCFCET